MFGLSLASATRREPAVEVMSTVSQNGYELVQKWLRVRIQASRLLIVKFHYTVFMGNGFVLEDRPVYIPYLIMGMDAVIIG